MKASIPCWSSFLVLICLPVLLCGQNNRLIEISAGVKHSLSYNDNTEGRPGYMISAEMFVPSYRVAVKYGIGFNRSSQFKSFVSGSRNISLRDVTYDTYSATVPILASIGLPDQRRFALETGIVIDLHLTTIASGVQRTFSWMSLETTEAEFRRHGNLRFPDFLLRIAFRSQLYKERYGLKIGYDHGLRDLRVDRGMYSRNLYFALLIHFSGGGGGSAE